MNIRIIHNNTDTTHSFDTNATIADARAAVNAQGGTALLNGGPAQDTTQLRNNDFLVFVGTSAPTPEPTPEPTATAPQAPTAPRTLTFKVGPVGVRPREVTIEEPFTAEHAVEAAGYDWHEWRPCTTTSRLEPDDSLANPDGSVRVDRILLGKAIEGNL